MVFVVTDENETKKHQRVGEIARVVHLSCPTGLIVHGLKDIVLSITPFLGDRCFQNMLKNWYVMLLCSKIHFIDIESVESSLKISHLLRGSW